MNEARDDADLLEALTGRREPPAGFVLFEAPAGEVLYEAGVVSDRLVLLFEGTCDVAVLAGGVGAVTSCGRGALLGDIAFIDGERASATVTVREAVRGASLTRESFDRIRVTDPLLAATLLRRIDQSLAERLRATTDLAERAATGTVAPVAQRGLLSSLLALFVGKA